MGGNGGIRVGRIFGIDIKIAWSWLLILGLVTWNLSNVFGQAHPEWNTALTWGLGFVAALLLFASVLAHELAHSLVAKSRGIPVEDITLHLFGGVSEIEEEPQAAGGEFLMAFVGPATSLVIGGALLLLGGAVASVRESGGNASELLSRLSPLSTLVLWLGSVNVALGVFNLIPAFPLDGGRVLRSILWGISGNYVTATKGAAYIGMAIALLMIGAGALMIFGVRIPWLGSGAMNGIWIALIGWFIYAGARRHLQRAGRART